VLKREGCYLLFIYLVWKVERCQERNDKKGLRGEEWTPSLYFCFVLCDLWQERSCKRRKTVRIGIDSYIFF
jgi:hypothetical protein